MREMPLERLHATGPGLQIARELEQQPLGGDQQRLGVPDLSGQTQAALEDGRRRIGQARIGALAEGAIETRQQPRIGAPRRAVPRQTNAIAEALDADAAQVLLDARGQIEKRQRHRREARRQLMHGRHRLLPSGPGQQPGAQRRRRNAETRAVTESVDGPAHPLEERVQAAEQRQAAADLQQQPVGRHQAHERGELTRPGGETLQRGGFRRLVAGCENEIRHQRAGGACRQAGVHAGARGVCVGGGDDGAGDHRHRRRGGARPAENLQRKARQVEREPQMRWPRRGRTGFPGDGFDIRRVRK